MDWDTYLRSTLALVAVLALIAGTAWLAKRFGLSGTRLGPRRKRRVSIAEILPLDGRRRLVLIQRDGIQHLLLIGGGSDIVIEKGIEEEGSEE
jgi:flagellar protein FliO/FliZ